MKRIAFVLVVLAAAAVAVGGAAAAHKATKLQASVSDPLNISLKLGTKSLNGKTLKAGKVTIVVKDTAADHNFHLTGPGVNKTTSVGGKSTVTWHLTLKKGTYTYVCDPHKQFMKGSFKVK